MSAFRAVLAAGLGELADEPINYHGKGFSLLGGKNRAVLPLSLRKDVIVSSRGERILGINKHHEWDCLIGFGQSFADNYRSWLETERDAVRAEGGAFDRHAMMMLFNGWEKVPFDASGRFVLSGDWLEVGNIGDEVYFQGAGDYLTIWAPDSLYAMEGKAFDMAKIACRRLQAEARKGKRK